MIKKSPKHLFWSLFAKNNKKSKLDSTQCFERILFLNISEKNLNFACFSKNIKSFLKQFAFNTQKIFFSKFNHFTTMNWHKTYDFFWNVWTYSPIFKGDENVRSFFETKTSAPGSSLASYFQQNVTFSTKKVITLKMHNGYLIGSNFLSKSHVFVLFKIPMSRASFIQENQVFFEEFDHQRSTTAVWKLWFLKKWKK